MGNKASPSRNKNIHQIQSQDNTDIVEEQSFTTATNVRFTAEMHNAAGQDQWRSFDWIVPQLQTEGNSVAVVIKGSFDSYIVDGSVNFDTNNVTFIKSYGGNITQYGQFEGRVDKEDHITVHGKWFFKGNTMSTFSVRNDFRMKLPLICYEIYVFAKKKTFDEEGDDEFWINDNAKQTPLMQLTAILNSQLALQNRRNEKIKSILAQNDSLVNAKEKAVAAETALLNTLLNEPKVLIDFLDHITLIENTFNALFDEKEREKQQNARKQYAINIEKYDINELNKKKKKEIRNEGIHSFEELMERSKTEYLRYFNLLIESIVEQCKINGISIINDPIAKTKGIERAFYKSFYVYDINDGFKSLTDILRCSFLFDSFTDLYQSFTVIERQLHKMNSKLLRVKDRFNPVSIPFGYRDILLNVYCPNTKVITEIQLHHTMFYKYKTISHTMYKKARLFERGKDNLAYEYAQKYVRPKIGDTCYLDPEEEQKQRDIQNMNVEQHKQMKTFIQTVENELKIGKTIDLNQWNTYKDRLGFDFLDL